MKLASMLISGWMSLTGDGQRRARLRGAIFDAWQHRTRRRPDVEQARERLAVVSHDLKGPLAAIRLRADISSRQGDLRECRQALTHIAHEADALLQLANELLCEVEIGKNGF